MLGDQGLLVHCIHCMLTPSPVLHQKRHDSSSASLLALPTWAISIEIGDSFIVAKCEVACIIHGNTHYPRCSGKYQAPVLFSGNRRIRPLFRVRLSVICQSVYFPRLDLVPTHSGRSSREGGGREGVWGPCCVVHAASGDLANIKVVLRLIARVAEVTMLYPCALSPFDHRQLVVDSVYVDAVLKHAALPSQRQLQGDATSLNLGGMGSPLGDVSGIVVLEMKIRTR